MKIAPQATKPLKSDFQLCIGLEPPAKRYEDDAKVKPKSFTCKVHPNKKDSPEFTVKIYTFSDGTPEEYIDTLKLVHTVEEGQSAKKNEEKVTLVKQVFEGALLEAFENEMPPDGTPISDDHLERGMVAMTKIVFPDKAACNQKKAMKKLRKPKNMTFREFANRMKKINEVFNFFPPMANGTDPKPMPDDEFLEMLHDTLPKIGYQNKMQEHDYDPTQHDFHDFVEWIERRCEPFDDREPRNKPTKEKDALDKPIPRKNKGKRKNDNQQSKDDGKRPAKRDMNFCFHHKWCDHTTDDCRVMQELHKKHAPLRKNFDKKVNDMHLMEEHAKSFVGSDEFVGLIQKECVKACLPLFKTFRAEMREDFHMMEPNSNAKEKAYLKAMKLNQATDDSMDEDKNESY